MKIKYTIQNDVNHYVVAQVSLATKMASIQYFNNTTTPIVENFQSVASVLDADPTVHPLFEVYKKGKFWDLVVSKTDTLGNTLRIVTPLELPNDLTATEMKVINNEAVDVTLQDYMTKVLGTYDRNGQIPVDSTEDSVTFKIPVTQAVQKAEVSRDQRKWTYTRNSTTIWDVHYQNADTGEDFDLPAVAEENGVITHLETNLVSNATYDYTVVLKNNNGQTLDTKMVYI